MFNVLTGFKFIGEKIHEFETQHNHTYMLGFEESFGYLIKPFVRDKDAIQAVLIVAEIAAYYRSRGMTLADGIEEIYKQYGYFAEKTISVTLSGVDGAAEIKKIHIFICPLPKLIYKNHIKSLFSTLYFVCFQSSVFKPGYIFIWIGVS